MFFKTMALTCRRHRQFGLCSSSSSSLLLRLGTAGRIPLTTTATAATASSSMAPLSSRIPNHHRCHLVLHPTITTTNGSSIVSSSSLPTTTTKRYFSAHVWYRGAVIASSSHNSSNGETEDNEELHGRLVVEIPAPETTALGGTILMDGTSSSNDTDDDDDGEMMDQDQRQQYHGLGRRWSLTSSSLEQQQQRLSFVSPESDFSYGSWWTKTKRTRTSATTMVRSGIQELPQTQQQYQLPLPTSIEQALHDVRPVVITKTSPPFDIVDVNNAWTDLCGYTREEVRNNNNNQSLGSLLQGPETDRSVLKDFCQRLVVRHEQEERRRHEQQQDAVVLDNDSPIMVHVTNYTKSGRKFHNCLRGGLLIDEGHNNGDNSSSSSSVERATHFFVGVLQEVSSC